MAKWQYSWLYAIFQAPLVELEIEKSVDLWSNQEYDFISVY